MNQASENNEVKIEETLVQQAKRLVMFLDIDETLEVLGVVYQRLKASREYALAEPLPAVNIAPPVTHSAFAAIEQELDVSIKPGKDPVSKLMPESTYQISPGVTVKLKTAFGEGVNKLFEERFAAFALIAAPESIHSFDSVMGHATTSDVSECWVTSFRAPMVRTRDLLVRILDPDGLTMTAFLGTAALLQTKMQLPDLVEKAAKAIAASDSPPDDALEGLRKYLVHVPMRQLLKFLNIDQ